MFGVCWLFVCVFFCFWWFLFFVLIGIVVARCAVPYCNARGKQRRQLFGFILCNGCYQEQWISCYGCRRWFRNGCWYAVVSQGPHTPYVPVCGLCVLEYPDKYSESSGSGSEYSGGDESSHGCDEDLFNPDTDCVRDADWDADYGMVFIEEEFDGKKKDRKKRKKKYKNKKEIKKEKKNEMKNEIKSEMKKEKEKMSKKESKMEFDD